jgi:regulator of nucleoside diphosphate kinase
MSTDLEFRLTARAASVLTAMLDYSPSAQPAFVALLRRKLSRSSICFGDDIPPGVVTLNSQVLYTVDGELEGPHLIVSSEGDDFPDYALSVHEIRGLALLGLAEGESIHVEEDGETPTMLSVVKVSLQSDGNPAPGLRGKSGGSSSVLAFRGRPQAGPSPDPDDPGPQAA